MTKLTNYTKGPKGVHTEDQGLVYIDGGKTSEDLNVSEGELKAAKATGWFSKPKGDEPTPAPKPEPTDKEIVDGLSQDDKAAYDKLDDAGKAKFITAKRAA